MNTPFDTLTKFAQSPGDLPGEGIASLWQWFLMQDPVRVQIPLFGALTLLAIICVLVVKLIRRQQLLEYPKDPAARFQAVAESDKPKPVPIHPTTQLPPLKPSQKRALSPTADDGDRHRGPLRFGHHAEASESESPDQEPQAAPEEKESPRGESG